MNVKRSNLVGLLTFAVLALFVGACGRANQISEIHGDSRSIALGDADSVTAELKMGAGELTVAGGADALVEADFTYSVADWKPVVDYVVSGGRGQLSIHQPEGLNLRVGSHRYEWDLRFNDEVPLDLNVALGAGKSLLDMRDLSLTRLDLDMGAGEVELDLRGERRQDLDVSIRGGVGEATVRLPKDVGIRVEVTGALGAVNAEGLRRDGNVYTNAAYGQSDVTLYLDIEGGVGEVNLEVEP